MLVTIIICTRNRAEYLHRTLESLSHVEVPARYTCELIVADNGSTDDTRRIVESCRLGPLGVRYLSEPREGVSHAKNAALASARGDVILFTDDDVRLPRNWIAGMCDPIHDGRADAVAGGIRVAPELLRPWMTIYHRGWLGSTERLNPQDPQDAAGGNASFDRKVLAAVPLFDPELGGGGLGYGEDTLFFWQVKAAGFKVTTALDVVVEHCFDPGRLSRRNWLAAARKHGRTQAYLRHHWKHETSDCDEYSILITAGQLIVRRLRHWRDMVRQEGCAEWELDLLSKLYLQGAYLAERHSPRKYERRGLVKRSFEVDFS